MKIQSKNSDMQLKEKSYYQTGGTCDLLVSPTSIEELANAMAQIHRDRIPCFFLGAGSNSLIMDDHWPGAVVLFERLNRIDIKDNRISVESGVENTLLAEKCLEASLAGCDWMYYLPGQLGATVRMNARCYGGEISQIVTSVTAVTPGGDIKQYTNEGIFKGYKDTLFMTNGEIIAEVDIDLRQEGQDQIRSRMAFCRSDREKKHQFAFPSCGCVFKNDYAAGVPSGMLLEKAGVRGLSTEQVEISPWHANFVFNRGATARHILEMTLQMRESVYDRFGVWLAFEMEILGLLPDDLKHRVSETRKPQFNDRELEPLRRRFASNQR